MYEERDLLSVVAVLEARMADRGVPADRRERWAADLAEARAHLSALHTLRGGAAAVAAAG